jgi:hypothetical protein
MGFLSALIPLLAGLTQPLKDYFSYKQQITKAEQDYKLALLQAQAEAAKQEAISQSTDLKNRLEATTKEFKQTTFWLLYAPILFTILFPKQAAEMWGNFNLVPEYFQWLFLSVYSAIWGIPIVKGGYGAITDLLHQRREYKLECKKAQYNRKAVFDTIKALFPQGMSQQQVDLIDRALDAGEQQ